MNEEQELAFKGMLENAKENITLLEKLSEKGKYIVLYDYNHFVSKHENTNHTILIGDALILNDIQKHKESIYSTWNSEELKSKPHPVDDFVKLKIKMENERVYTAEKALKSEELK